VVDPEEGESLFVHFSEVESEAKWKNLRKKMKVEFARGSYTDRKGTKITAANVTEPGGVPIPKIRRRRRGRNKNRARCKASKEKTNVVSSKLPVEESEEMLASPVKSTEMHCVPRPNERLAQIANATSFTMKELEMTQQEIQRNRDRMRQERGLLLAADAPIEKTGVLNPMTFSTDTKSVKKKAADTKDVKKKAVDTQDEKKKVVDARKAKKGKQVREVLSAGSATSPVKTRKTDEKKKLRRVAELKKAVANVTTNTNKVRKAKTSTKKARKVKEVQNTVSKRSTTFPAKAQRTNKKTKQQAEHVKVVGPDRSRELEAKCKRLEKQIAKLQLKTKCAICREKDKTHMYMPCNCLATCDDCFWRTSECPVCEESIEDCKKVLV